MPRSLSDFMIRSLTALAATAALALPLLAQTPSPAAQGAALFEQGRYEEAKKLLAPLANDPQALFILGKIAVLQNDAGKAAGYLEKAVAKNGNVSEYHSWLGQAYGSQAQSAGMLSQASLAKKTQAELERAVQLDPNNLDARSGLIDYYLFAPGFMGGSDDKAREQATEIRKRDSFQGHRAFARIYNHGKQTDLARNELIAAVREQPSLPKTHYTLGTFYIGEKNYKASLEEMDAALKLDPNYMPAVFQIGHLAVLSSSNFVRGEESLRRYLGYKPQSGEPPLGRAYYWLGGIYEKQGKKADAKANYAQSLKLNPGAKDVAEAVKRLP
jgi:tetratricopeptide (TPR) repeat protein